MRRQPRCLAIETLGSRDLLTSVSGELVAYDAETRLIESVEIGSATPVDAAAKADFNLVIVPPPPSAGILDNLEWIRLHPEDYPDYEDTNT